MNALFLLVLLSASPAQWDGHVWHSMPTEVQVAYVGGLMGGLEVGSVLSKNPTLPIRGIPVEDIVVELDLFYLDESNRYVSIPNALLIVGKRRHR